MLLQKRIERAFKKQKEDKANLPSPAALRDEELYIEKGDFAAMWIAAVQMILLPALLVLLLIAGLAFLLFRP